MKKSTILLKKVTSQLNADEEIVFQAWLKKSKKNSLLYENLLFLKKEKNHINTISKLDVNEAWSAIQEKLKLDKEINSNSYFHRRRKRFAVVFSVVVLISLIAIFNKKDVFDPTLNTSPIIVNNQIEVGTDKAILTLEDGTLVALNKNEAYYTSTIKSDGKQIIYEPSNGSKAEIKYNYLTIPRGGQFFVKLSDGTQVWLNSDSQLKYPVNFIDGITRKIELIYGEAFFDVTSSIAHKGSKFKVFTNGQEIEVIGTQFNIKAYKEEKNIYTTLLEGKVSVSVHSNNKYLEPNQQSNFNLVTNSLMVSGIDAKKEIAWKDGVFNFDSKVLKEIMVVLSRWYDMDVVFDNKTLENQKFVGLINKNRSIEDILSIMKDTNIITNYTIDNKTITLK